MIPNRYADAGYSDVPKEIRERFEKIIDTRRGMYLWGATGSGKTHILYALKRQWDSERTKKAMHWNMTDLMHEIRQDMDRTHKERPAESIMDFNGILFIDDIGAEKISEFALETIYMVINRRYEKRWPVIFSSNLPISELADRVGDRIASRIVEMCDIVEIVGSDRRMDEAESIRVEFPAR